MHICVSVAAPNSAVDASVVVAEEHARRTLVQLGEAIKVAPETPMLDYFCRLLGKVSVAMNYPSLRFVALRPDCGGGQ